MSSIGFMYVGKRSCGRVSALVWDDPKYAKDTAKSVAEFIKNGLVVERIERREGDPLPEMICKECRGGKPCKEPAAIASATGEKP
jgi:nucleotide-binding universal stress UspA family protein